MAKFRRLENGFGNISKLSGNRRKPYRVRKTVGYNDKGHQIYETIGYYETYTSAFEALVEFNKNPYDLTQKEVTLKEVAEMFFEEQKKILKQTTVNTLITTINKIKPIEHMKFKDVKSDTIQRLVDDQIGSVKKRLLTFFKNIYKFARKKDIFVKDYSEFIVINQTGDKAKTTVVKVPFTNEEIKKCWDNKGTFEYDLTLLLLFTGMRPTELLELKRENIFLKENYLIGGNKTESGTNRTIPISRHIKDILEKLLDNDNKYLLYNSRKNKMVYKNLNGAISKIFNHTPHECRHTFVSNMQRTDINIQLTKAIVGHSTSDVTESVYTHKTMEELQEAMRTFDDFMGNIIK